MTVSIYLAHLNPVTNAHVEIMEELKKLREEIDRIDSQIMTLLQERFGVIKQVGEVKKQNEIPFIQKNRWEELLDKKIQMAGNL